LQELERERDDTEPAALCCYGLLRADNEQMLLRFVENRPVSAVTTSYLGWLSEKLAAEGKKVLVLVWDNASWHRSKIVGAWIAGHNRVVRELQRQGKAGLRILVFYLPVKSPWLNPIEPKWVHGKKAIVEPHRVLSAKEVRERVHAYFGCASLELLNSNTVG